jgi:plastocyanin
MLRIRSAGSLAPVAAALLVACNTTPSVVDLGAADLAIPSGSDLTMPPGADLTIPAGADLAMQQDLVVPPDLAPLPDLTPLPDLALPSVPDLTSLPPDLVASGPITFNVTVAPGGATMFSPSAANIHVGDTVMWTWAGNGHTVTSGDSLNCLADGIFCDLNDQNCGSAPRLNAGATYSHTFTTAGTFTYFCQPHCFAGMLGRVVVVP